MSPPVVQRGFVCGQQELQRRRRARLANEFAMLESLGGEQAFGAAGGMDFRSAWPRPMVRLEVRRPAGTWVPQAPAPQQAQQAVGALAEYDRALLMTEPMDEIQEKAVVAPNVNGLAAISQQYEDDDHSVSISGALASSAAQTKAPQRATVGDRVVIKDTRNTRDHFVEGIGQVFVIRTDAKDQQPYQIDGGSHAWLFPSDVELAAPEAAPMSAESAKPALLQVPTPCREEAKPSACSADSNSVSMTQDDKDHGDLSELKQELFRRLAGLGMPHHDVKTNRTLWKFINLSVKAITSKDDDTFNKLLSILEGRLDAPRTAEFAAFLRDQRQSQLKQQSDTASAPPCIDATAPHPPEASEKEEPEVAPAPVPEAHSALRDAVQATIFSALDLDKDGFLCSSEMLVFARLVGFDGPSERWQIEFQDMCRERRMDASRGITSQCFAAMLDDTSHQGCYCSNDELANLFRMISANASSTGQTPPASEPAHSSALQPPLGLPDGHHAPCATGGDAAGSKEASGAPADDQLGVQDSAASTEPTGSLCPSLVGLVALQTIPEQRGSDQEEGARATSQEPAELAGMQSSTATHAVSSATPSEAPTTLATAPAAAPAPRSPSAPAQEGAPPTTLPEAIPVPGTLVAAPAEAALTASSVLAPTSDAIAVSRSPQATTAQALPTAHSTPASLAAAPAAGSLAAPKSPQATPAQALLAATPAPASPAATPAPRSPCATPAHAFHLAPHVLETPAATPAARSPLATPAPQATPVPRSPVPTPAHVVATPAPPSPAATSAPSSPAAASPVKRPAATPAPTSPAASLAPTSPAASPVPSSPATSLAATSPALSGRSESRHRFKRGPTNLFDVVNPRKQAILKKRSREPEENSKVAKRGVWCPTSFSKNPASPKVSTEQVSGRTSKRPRMTSKDVKQLIVSQILEAPPGTWQQQAPPGNWQEPDVPPGVWDSSASSTIAEATVVEKCTDTSSESAKATAVDKCASDNPNSDFWATAAAKDESHNSKDKADKEHRWADFWSTLRLPTPNSDSMEKVEERKPWQQRQRQGARGGA